MVPHSSRSIPAEVSHRATAIAGKLLSPIDRFLHVETASGLVLLASAAVALIVANTPLAPVYHDALETPVGLVFGARVVVAPVHFWVNDVMMTVFFFVVGLEIRREIHAGELASWRRAALPVAAALGGMIAPALVYAACNRSPPTSLRGWGVPMATDIAFAVGVLALLGRRVPPALRVLLLAVAIIDDIGSILVIAIFYSSGFRAGGLLVAGAGVGVTIAFQRFGVRRALAYVAPGALVWYGILRSGVHPTLAGVAMGLLTPAKAWFGPEGLVAAARDAATHVARGLAEGEPGRIPAHQLRREVRRLEKARREVLSPAARLQASLHPWVAFGIMPLFAFANAGVTLGQSGPVAATTISLGIVAGLVLGKPAGVLFAVFAASRSGLAVLPRGIRWRELAVLGLVAGIGFTMAIFIASLAFADATRLDEAKLAILVASAIAGLAGLVVGRFLLPSAFVRGAAASALEAEISDRL